MFSSAFIFLQAATPTPSNIDGGSGVTWLIIVVAAIAVLAVAAYMGTRSNSNKVDGNALKDEIRAETNAKLGDMASQQRVSTLEKELAQLKEGHRDMEHRDRYHVGQTTYSPKN